MRNGFTLVEMLVVVIVVPLVFIFLDGLFSTLLADIPRSYKISQESITLQHVLEQMQQDMDKAASLPEAYGKFAVNEKQFLIELSSGVVCYQLKDDQIIRQKLLGAEMDNAGDKRTWTLPNTKVGWKTWTKDKQGHAVEIKTRFEYKTRGRWKKTMANSHLFYAEVLR